MPLSPLGEQQAKCLAACFNPRKVAGLYTSSLRRSRQTAQAIAESNGHALAPVVDAELAEMHLGEWEGLTPDEVDARFNRAYQQWRGKPSSVLIPGAEPLDAFRIRVRRALDRIVAAMPQGESVVVSHGGVIAAVLADLLGADYDSVIRRLRLDNAGITAVEFDAPLPHVLWINSTIHLEPLAEPHRGGWF
jgi:broad specificity phosphatase PhoE